MKTISIEAKADNRGLNGLERAMRTSGNDHADPVITFDDAAFANDGHDSALECPRPCVPVVCNRPSKLFWSWMSGAGRLAGATAPIG